MQFPDHRAYSETIPGRQEVIFMTVADSSEIDNASLTVRSDPANRGVRWHILHVDRTRGLGLVCFSAALRALSTLPFVSADRLSDINIGTLGWENGRVEGSLVRTFDTTCSF